MTAEIARRSRSATSVAQTAFLSCTFVLLVLGDVLAFNQLATQSATDAILQVLVFAIGGAGIFECVRRLVCGTSSHHRWSAAIPGLLSAAAFASWRLQVPVGWFVLVTIGAAAFTGTVSVRALRGTGDRNGQEADQLLGLFCLAQTIIFVYVAALATVDAGSTLFG